MVGPNQAITPGPLRVDIPNHLPDRRSYFARLARYLKPGGRVAVVEVKPRGLHRLVGHATSSETIRSELGAAGYVPVAEQDFLPRQGFLVFEHRRALQDR